VDSPNVLGEGEGCGVAQEPEGGGNVLVSGFVKRSVAVFPLSIDVGAGFGEETDALGAGTFGGIAAVLIGGGTDELQGFFAALRMTSRRVLCRE
jgi:hypothetical protein